jgi:hypothetical protein
MASEAFLRRNPRYREAEWKSRGPREKKPNVRVSNLDEFHFKNQGYSSEEAKQMATEAADSGMRTRFGGGGIESVNRRPSFRKEARTPSGPTDDQRKWARKFREGQTRRATSTPSAPDQGLGGAMGGSVITPSATAPETPLNFSRSAMIEGAKKSGDFARTRESFNKQSAAAQTGQRMDGNGSIQEMDKTKVGADGLTDYAREKFGPAVEDIRARRDFATGKSTTTSGTTGLSSGMNSNPNADEMTPGTGGVRPTQAADFRREITSNYGRGSNVTRTDGQAGGKMSDPLTGNQVPIRQWGRDQTGVQETKEGTSGWGENRTTNKAGDDYLNPQKIRQDAQRSGGGSARASSAGPAQRSGGGSRK